MMKRSLLFIWLLLNFFLTASGQQINTIFPINHGQQIVYDASHLFTDEQKKELAFKLIKYEVATTNEIAVVTIDSITPYTDIQKYASNLANYRGIGKDEKGNRLLVVILKPLRKSWSFNGSRYGKNTDR